MKVQEYVIHRRKFRVWYDKTWYAIEVDAEGNQIGETIDGFQRDMVLIYIGVRVGEKKVEGV